MEGGLSFDPERTVSGSNSGYQAINIAVHFGGVRVLLLAYDMKWGPKGKIHHHEDHKGRNPGQDNLARWATIFNKMIPDLKKAGVEVINCSRETAITAFPRARLEDVL